jgi:hypothetical protein
VHTDAIANRRSPGRRHGAKPPEKRSSARDGLTSRCEFIERGECLLIPNRVGTFYRAAYSLYDGPAVPNKRIPQLAESPLRAKAPNTRKPILQQDREQLAYNSYVVIERWCRCEPPSVVHTKCCPLEANFLERLGKPKELGFPPSQCTSNRTRIGLKQLLTWMRKGFESWQPCTLSDLSPQSGKFFAAQLELDVRDDGLKLLYFYRRTTPYLSRF